MRYAYAITGALLLSGAAAAMTIDQPAAGQTAQNEPGVIAAAAPKAGAPMSFADMVATLQPAASNRLRATSSVPSRIRYHNAPSRVEERGNILSWEQPLRDRLMGLLEAGLPPAELEACRAEGARSPHAC